MMCNFFNFFGSTLFFLTVFRVVQRTDNTDKKDFTISSGMTSRVIRRYENLKKRPNDVHSYRGLELDNSLKILLISDSTLSDGAAVVLSVGAGSLNDSDDCPGIATLVGEMLKRFGISEYPDQDIVEIVDSRLPDAELSDVVFPDTKEDTQYFALEMDSDSLTPVMEIFAQYFNEPLLSTANSRNLLEIGIHHLEWIHSPNVLDEEEGAPWRFRQVERSISAKNHPFSHTPYGNGETFTKYLVEDEEPLIDESFEPRPTILHKKIREFHSKWYSSNIMCLIVYGKESLDQLERITVPLFENIPNKHVERLSYSYEQHPWGQEQLRRKIYATFYTVSNFYDETVRLIFRVPDVRHQYKTGPELYVSDILKRGGPGSLISVLRERKLCASRLDADYDVIAGIAFFKIKCSIPPNSGMKENEIVELVTQYIRLIRRDGINEMIFQEKELYNRIFPPRSHHVNKLDSLVSAMHYYPMQDILSYKYPDAWNPSLIEDFLNYLTPDNMNIFISSKKYKSLDGEPVEWHNIPYKVEVIPDSLIQSWNTMEISSDLQAPRPNEFIPENLDIYPIKQGEPENPYIVYESSRSRIWLLQDNESSKVVIKFDLINLRARLHPSNSTLLCIFLELLNHQMVEYKYASNTVQYEWNIRPGEISISIELFGYLDKIRILLKKFMSKIEIDRYVGSHLQDQFEKAKAECITREITRKNFPSAVHRLKYVLTETAGSWSSDQIIAASRLLRFDDWKKFISKMLPRVFIQGLILGNCTQKIAIDIAKIIEMPFGLAVEFIPQEMISLLPRAVEMENGKHFLDITMREIGVTYHLHCTYYQLGLGNNWNLVVSSLLLLIIQETCLVIEQNILPFYSDISHAHSVVGLMFWTRPTDDDIDLNDSLFESCLKKVNVVLEELTDWKFRNYKKMLIRQERQFPASSTARYWNNMTRGFYSFQEDIENPTKNFKQIIKSDIVTLFKDTLLEHSPHRRKYSVVLLPKNSESVPLNSISDVTKVEDVIDFKNNSNFLALPSPFMHINFFQRWRIGTT